LLDQRFELGLPVAEIEKKMLEPTLGLEDAGKSQE